MEKISYQDQEIRRWDVGPSTFLASPEKGALPIVQAALATDAQNGEYFGPTGFMELWGDPGKAVPTKYALDPGVGTKLWLESERLTGEPFFS